MKNPYITANRIYLRNIEKDDLPEIAKWMNDEEVTHYLFMGTMPTHLQSLTEAWEKQIKNQNEIELAIIDKETDRMVGWAGLYSINWVSRSAEYRIFIGDKEYWNKGIGTEVAGALVKYGFEKLNLNKIWLGVNASHKGAFRSYEKAGFVKEGILRQEIFGNNQYYDAVRMSILRKEYGGAG